MYYYLALLLYEVLGVYSITPCNIIQGVIEALLLIVVVWRFIVCHVLNQQRRSACLCTMLPSAWVRRGKHGWMASFCRV